MLGPAPGSTQSRASPTCTGRRGRACCRCPAGHRHWRPSTTGCRWPGCPRWKQPVAGGDLGPGRARAHLRQGWNGRCRAYPAGRGCCHPSTRLCRSGSPACEWRRRYGHPAGVVHLCVGVDQASRRSPKLAGRVVAPGPERAVGLARTLCRAPAAMVVQVRACRSAPARCDRRWWRRRAGTLKLRPQAHSVPSLRQRQRVGITHRHGRPRGDRAHARGHGTVGEACRRLAIQVEAQAHSDHSAAAESATVWRVLATVLQVLMVPTCTGARRSALSRRPARPLRLAPQAHSVPKRP